MRYALLTLGLTAIALGACTSVSQRSGLTAINGHVSYRERVALAAGARVTVELADITRADAPATILSRHDIDLHGEQVPVDFTLWVDRAALAPGKRLAVQARITQGDDVRFLTATPVPVDPTRVAEAMNIELQQAHL